LVRVGAAAKVAWSNIDVPLASQSDKKTEVDVKTQRSHKAAQFFGWAVITLPAAIALLDRA